MSNHEEMNVRNPYRIVAWLVAILAIFTSQAFAADHSGSGPMLRVLFLGDKGHHRPKDRFDQIQPVLAKKGIELVYTESLQDLNPEKLTGYDCLAIYANHTSIAPDQEKAILDFVAAGGGLAPIHCASYCFLNSPKYIELVGAQFKSHGGGVFKETIVRPDHPILEGIEAIESWDETYVHTKHNTNRVVLSERRDEKGNEPWTWVREHGKGRVFYTAWGHDQRTWSNPGFQLLIEKGIRWASANSPTMLKPKSGLKPFEYSEAPAPLPNYVAGARWGTQAEPIRTMQKPLEPSESAKHLVTFPEFQSSLVASEPDITKPIWLSWDERGRLWIAETIDYPNELQPAGQGRDRLKICEDTDGDGRADKFKVFADQLSVPTGFVFAKGGVIVIHSGKTEFLKDTNGDDQVDERTVLFSGWGMSDTHATASNLRYGFDNWIWGVVGYSGFQGTVGGKEVRFGQGIFRFKPDGSQLEFVRSSNNNTWGLGLSEDGIIFGSTANGNASMYMPIANRFYETVRGWSASRLESIADSQNFYPITEKVRQVDWHGKYTAGSGSALYTARQFPEEYWNRVQFVAEPTGHLLGKFHIRAQGADFVAHNGRNFLASDDEWTSPIAAEVGPDGALWVADWYNYIIQHNPVPQGFQNGKGNAYVTPLRDKVHGRIYRVSYPAAKHKPVIPKLNPKSPESLVAALKNDNLLWRLHAQRLLVERGNKDVVPALVAMTKDTGKDELGLNPGAIHALWALKGLGALENAETSNAKSIVSSLEHPSPAVRRAALEVLPRNEDSLRLILDKKLLSDSDAQVRLVAFLAISEMPVSEDAAKAIFAALQEPRNADDRWIRDAAAVAAARNDAGFLRAVLSSFKPKDSSSSASVGEAANLIKNASFEEVKDGKPSSWNEVRYGGQASHSLGDLGKDGSRSVKITSNQGADASWSTRVAVTPRTDYRLTAWIKTEGLEKVGGARGALLNIHELQDAERGATKPLVGNNDWTRVQLDFNSGEMTELTVNCLLGGWGRARGTAWFDQIELKAAPNAAFGGEAGKVIRLVTSHYAQRGPVDTIVPTLLALKGASASVAAPVLDGFVSGWPEEKAPELGDADKRQLSALMENLPEAVRDRLLALAQRWGKQEIFAANVSSIIENLSQDISKTGSADEQRVAAAKRLMVLSDKPESIDLILNQVTLTTPPALSSGFMSALAEGRNPNAGKSIVSKWNQLTPAARRSAISALMRRPEWAQSLLDGVESGAVLRGDLAAEHWSQLKQSPNRNVARRANALSTANTQVSSERKEIVEKLLPLAKSKGDVARGKEVFASNCANCHQLNGQGGKIGPDLTGISSRDRTDILLEILDPNRSVEANYRLWNVTTKDGETYSGRLEAETQTSVEILDTASQKHVIQRKDIATLEGSPLSIMPNGFETLPEEDLKGLVEFLAQPH